MAVRMRELSKREGVLLAIFSGVLGLFSAHLLGIWGTYTDRYFDKLELEWAMESYGPFISL